MEIQSSKRWRLAGAAIAFTACVGVAAVAVRSAQAQGQGTNVRLSETEAGNLIADAVRAAGGAEISFVPAVAFKPRAGAARDISPEQAAALLDSASDPIVLLNLRGEQILAALERSVSFGAQPFAGFLQVSGIRFAYDSRRDTGKRVQSVTVGGKPLDPNKTYRVAATRALANGANGYFQIWSKDQIAADTGKTLRGAIDELAKTRGGALTASVEGRIAPVAP